MKNSITTGTVFSGVGAVEFALKRLGVNHKIMFACDNGNREIEIDLAREFLNVKQLRTVEEKKIYVEDLYNQKTRKQNYVQKTYLANFHIENNNYFQDIRLFDGETFKNKIDLFVGGSPCQSFSSVGPQKGLEDSRGTLFYDFARLVSEIKPKVFIYENVRNLINHDKGNTWTIIKSIFDKLGYHYKFDVLNSSNYDIPQNRRRIFLVGFKEKKFYELFEFPKYKKVTRVMNEFLIEKNNFGSITYDQNGDLLMSKKRGITEEKYFLTPKLYAYVMKGGTKSFYQEPKIDLPVARTLLSTMGNRHRAGVDNYVTVNGKVRMLTEREAFRLMGFTDDFKIVVSRSQAYKQAGNSIVVDVLMELIKCIIKTKVFGGQ